MNSRVVAALLAFALLVLVACGGGDDSESATTGGSAGEVAGDAHSADVEVIDGWVTALRHGDVDAAAEHFAIPSVAENGPVLVRIRSLEDARRFNESLPCGARLIHAETTGEFTTATFQLTERPGPGRCGPGTGGIAKTSFVIRDGEIVQWRRVGADAGGTQAPGNPT
jgi:limonene-1,2-epoxide hydrolase